MRTSSRQRVASRRRFPQKGIVGIRKEVIKRFNSRYPFADTTQNTLWKAALAPKEE